MSVPVVVGLKADGRLSARPRHDRSLLISALPSGRNLLGALRLDRLPIERKARMADKDLKALFLHQLKDVYSAEKAILKALPEMAQAAQAEELRGALAVHLKETEEQVKRLDQVLKIVGEKAGGIECKAIQGIIEEGREVMREFQGGDALDAGIIAAAQAVEHYEITRYGTLLAWAKQLGMSDVEELLRETLVEEENTDQLLSELAEDAVNPAAAAAA